MNAHTAKLWFRYTCRKCECTATDIKVFSAIALLFALVVIYWVHSPGYYAEKDYQRQHAIDFLRLHQWDMRMEDVRSVMQEYHITETEIKSPWEVTP